MDLELTASEITVKKAYNGVTVNLENIDKDDLNNEEVARAASK